MSHFDPSHHKTAVSSTETVFIKMYSRLDVIYLMFRDDAFHTCGWLQMKNENEIRNREQTFRNKNIFTPHLEFEKKNKFLYLALSNFHLNFHAPTSSKFCPLAQLVSVFLIKSG